MYIECAKKVAEKNIQDPNKGTTVILNELLADDTWLALVNCIISLCEYSQKYKSFIFSFLKMFVLLGPK